MNNTNLIFESFEKINKLFNSINENGVVVSNKVTYCEKETNPLILNKLLEDYRLQFNDDYEIE